MERWASLWQADIMTSAPETCDYCGFDSTEWNDRDTVKTIGHAGDLAAHWTAGVDSSVAAARSVRPAPADPFSIVEFVSHVADTYRRMHRVIRAGLDGAAITPDETGQTKPSADAPPVALDDAVQALDDAGRDLAAMLRKLTPEQWEQAAFDGSNHHEVRWTSRHVVHDLFHHLKEVAEIRVAAGDGVPTQDGLVVQLSRSGGGVPKLPVDQVEIGRRGMIGDLQKTRSHHGRPWQALCLWSSDVIDALVAEGHEIFPGAAGENITVNGIDWASLRGGVIVEIGDMRCQLSTPAEPCSTISQWFAANDSNRINHAKHPGWSRWYASVIEPGLISVGASVKVIS